MADKNADHRAVKKEQLDGTAKDAANETTAVRIAAKKMHQNNSFDWNHPSVEAVKKMSVPYPAGTSAFLIVFLHLLFFHHWNVRKRRKDMSVSYRTIVEKRQYHRAWLSLLSHPPLHTHQRHQRTSENQSRGGNAAALASSSRSGGNLEEDLHGNPRQPQSDIRTRLSSFLRQSFKLAYQSGFALMLYNSHILWSCRALEVLYNVRRDTPDPDKVNSYNSPENSDNSLEPTFSFNPLQYARVLFSLAAIALLLEFQLSAALLKTSKRLAGSEDPSSVVLEIDGSSSSSVMQNRIQRKIVTRPIGTLTALSCALIVVFQHRFEFIPLQVLPFIDNRWMLLGFNFPTTLSSFFCWTILGCLSYPIHPLTPVVCGIASGILWSIGFTSFLQEPYWGNFVVFAVSFLSCLSIRASGNRTREIVNERIPTWIPCVDFVAWNYRGETIGPGLVNQANRTSTADDWDRSESGMTSSSIAALNRTSSDTNDNDSDSSRSEVSLGASSFNSSDQDELYGRIPNIEDTFDDLDESNNDVEMPLLHSNHEPRDRGQTVRSRRGVSFG